MMKQTESLRISQLKYEAREVLNGNWIRTVSVSVLLLFGFLTVSYITGLFGAGFSAALMSFVTGLILQLLLSLMFDGGFLYFLHLYGGENAHPRDVFLPFTMQPDRFLIVGLIKSGTGLLLYLPLLPAYLNFNGRPSFWRIYIIVWLLIGTALIIAFRTAAAMTSFLLLGDADLGPLDALRKSFAMTKGRRLKLFLLLLSFVPFGLLGIMTAGIGYLWILPYCMASVTRFWLTVKDEPHDL